MQEAEIWRMAVSSQSGHRKVGKIPSQWKKLGMVVHVCIPVTAGNIKYQDCGSG
jgi:hypothetical protein